MDLAVWLKHELNRRRWTEADLAQQAALPVSTVTAVLQAQAAPDFEFCFRMAQALDKQPARLLSMAGLLSEAGLKLALELAAGTELGTAELRRQATELSPAERRLLLACFAEQPPRNADINAVRLPPEEWNSAERTQDRVRFAFLVLGLLLVVVGLSLAIGLLLVAL